MEKNTHTIFSLMSLIGLDLSVKSGGSWLPFDPDFSICSSNRAEMVYPDGSTICFLDGDIFLQSIRNTERSFKIKLFE